MIEQMTDWIAGIVRQGFPCLFHLVTGFYCPGCGGTRSVRFLIHGNWRESFIYHPVVPYMALVAAAELITWLLSKVFKKKKLFIGRLPLFVYVGLGIVLINWAYKNYMLIAKGIDLLS